MAEIPNELMTLFQAVVDADAVAGARYVVRAIQWLLEPDAVSVEP